MYLHEFQSKQVFRRFGLPVPPGRTVETPADARAAAAEFGVPVVVNAQVLDNPRVFRLASTPDDAEPIARDILAMTIAGIRVHTLLIEPALDVAAEYLLGLYGDRGSSLILAASGQAGTAVRETIDPFLGVLEFQARNLANGLNLPHETWGAFTQMAQNLYRCASACDAVRAEINPLGLTRRGELMALGGRLVIDDNALFRQSEIAALRDTMAEHERAVQARAAGINYVRLNGTVGCIVSGAGLGLATMDMLAHYARPASCFLDMGSDLQQDRLSIGLRLILPDSRAILFNLFADRVSCDEIARDLLAALDAAAPPVPVLVRLAGRGADEAAALFADRPGVTFTSSLRAAVERLADVDPG